MNQEKKLDYNLKLIAKSSLFVFIGYVLAKILGYSYRIIIARFFGPEIYGLFLLTIMIILWFVSLFSLGLFEGILRFIPIYRGKKEINKIRYLFKFSIIILFISSIFAGFLLFLLSGFISINLFHNSDLILILKLSSFIIPFFILSYGFLSIINAYEKIKVHTIISDFLFNFIKLSFLIFFILIGMRVNGVIISYLLGILGIFFISYFYCKYKLTEIFEKSKLGIKEKKLIKKEIITYSLPLAFLGLIWTILPQIDSFSIAYFKTAFEVGIYNAAVPIAGLMSFFPTLFIRLFFPLVTREFSQNNLEIVEELSKQVQKWILIIILPFFLVMFVFPGTFLNILFGANYLLAENSLRILAVGFFFSSFVSVSYYLIMMVGKTKVILFNIVLASIINLILNIFLIPKYGISGAAFATTISNITIGTIILFQLNHYIHFIPLRRSMLKITLSALIASFILIYIKQFVQITYLNTAILTSFFLLLYLLLILITKSLDKNDLMILKTIKKKFPKTFTLKSKNSK